MKFTDKDRLLEAVASIRKRLEKAFSPDTAITANKGLTLSAGQCAAASIVTSKVLGADYVSAQPSGKSHWFNRVKVGNEFLDVDLTGDQFGRPAIQIAPAGQLYSKTRVRKPDEIHIETLERAKLLAVRAGLNSVEDAINLEIKRKRHEKALGGSREVY